VIPAPTPDLAALVGLFYQDPAELGTFEEVPRDQVPPPYRELLVHEHHMTVTVEAYHGSPVDVRVVRKKITPTRYARLILLARQSDGAVVQFGIMRVNFAYLDDEVRKRIESESTPLGRILIEHDVLREIRLFSVWKVAPGPDLRRLFGLTSPQTTYGRTAIIDLNGEPAVELLEIVTPAKPVLQ
jgi:chorismate-pyruvate lyase